MHARTAITSIFLTALLCLAQQAHGTRIKDIAEINGVRSNQLIGYGLVVGLDGTGDDDKTEFTFQSLVSMLEKLGIVVDPSKVDIDNVAAVMVTADLPPFAKVGTSVDVVVSSIGNAESLQGGTLLMTPLKGLDSKVYAVAQGPLSIGGFSFGGAAGGAVQKNHPTVGMIAGGAMIEREVPVDLAHKTILDISLREPDFTTSLRVARAIENSIGTGQALAADAGTVQVRIPDEYKHDVVAFVARIENLSVSPDSIAKVVLNERTGTVVIGEHVRISRVAISHGNLSIVVKEQPGVSQPLPFSAGQTVVVPQSEVKVQEQKANLILISGGASIGEVIRGLNAIGVTPRDLIAVIQAIKGAGALQAELKII